MLAKSVVLALMGVAAVSEATAAHRNEFKLARDALFKRANRAGSEKSTSTGTGTPSKNTNGVSATCLAAGVLQTGSESTGQVNNVPADGQTNSAT